MEVVIMTKISSYVFFDIETTGLPHMEKNQTKITECSFVAVLRKDLEITQYGDTPPVSKLTFVLNPERQIDPAVTHLTGLSNDILRHAPLFREKIRSVIAFLEYLPSPVCLVAHNGNCFDFKILLAECNDAGTCLPTDLMCVDSLIGFRRILKDNSVSYTDLEKPAPASKIEELLTDDEDDWPDLSISNEEWNEIDDLSVSLSDLSCEDEEKTATKKAKVKQCRSEAIRKVFGKSTNNSVVETNKKTYNKVIQNSDLKLTTLYKRLLNKEALNAHRAEEDCLMLVKCVVALKTDFLLWADNNCKLLTEIKPLIRYKSFK